MEKHDIIGASLLQPSRNEKTKTKKIFKSIFGVERRTDERDRKASKEGAFWIKCKNEAPMYALKCVLLLKIIKFLKKSEVIFLENYVKVVLYAYPLLETVSKDYAEHIRNKALLSYDNGTNAERLATYLAGEILQKEKLEELKAVVESVLSRLSEVERALVAIRYFGKKKKAKDLLKMKDLKSEDVAVLTSSERSYFRRLQKLSEKVAAMLQAEGVTKERFVNEYADIDIIRKVQKFVERKEGA